MYIHNMSPTICKIGFLEVRWYGVAYAVSFLIGFWFLWRRSRKKELNLTKDQLESFINYLLAGVILGGRIGFFLFYNLKGLWQDPIELFRVWHGGMSFHGGLLGVIIAVFCFARRYQKSFFHLTDNLALIAPIGLGLGRLANFINGELPGRVADVPWAMIFPLHDMQPRHPSQLYEMMLEGFLLFGLIFFIDKTCPSIRNSWIFLIGYGIARWIVEFFREPDVGLGFVFMHFTMGQILSSFMIIAGLLLIFLTKTSQGVNIHTVSQKK